MFREVWSDVCASVELQAQRCYAEDVVWGEMVSWLNNILHLFADTTVKA